MAKSMVLGPIVLIIVVLDPMQSIGWVVLYCVYVVIVLDGIILKLQCFACCRRVLSYHPFLGCVEKELGGM